jgi:hypothetical protein
MTIGLALDFLQEPILVINIGGIDYYDWHNCAGFIEDPVLPVFLKNRPLMLPQPSPWKRAKGRNSSL